LSEGTAAESGIADRLFREGYMFSFFQSVRLLEILLPDGRSPGESSDLKEERIRFRPYHGLTFPSADIWSIERPTGTAGYARITATFMGLYGVDSPLPGWFYEPIAMEREGVAALRDFLDIFNHRLYALFYRTWKKYRLFLSYSRPPARNDLMARMLSLSGLGTRSVTDGLELRAVHLGAFAGILSSQVRNAEGLRNMLAELLREIGVAIVQNVPRWVNIPERSRLGPKATGPYVLSVSSALGERVYDISGKFRVVLGPLTLAQYVALLPGGDLTRVVRTIVRLYVRDTLEYDVQLILRTAEIPLMRLGDQALKVGLTTWLGRPRSETTSRLVEYDTNSHSLIPSGAL
jgi:type VI secretion system protein ImpH